MFVPFISTRSSRRTKQLYPRGKGKGGGGAGGGGGSESGGGGSGGGGTSGSGTDSGGGGGTNGSGGSGSDSRPRAISTQIDVGDGSRKTAFAYGKGGGSPITIPSGKPFAGRSAGGGTREQVFGTQEYGSGYPGGNYEGRGTLDNRPFPFWFWPVVWGGVRNPNNYLHTNDYGRPDNPSRPGGPLLYTTIESNHYPLNTTFRLLADRVTVNELVSDVRNACWRNLRIDTPMTPAPYNDSLFQWPQPEQVIQYYRASSVALTLDHYNNTGVFSADRVPNTPLLTNIDTTLLGCLNQTIGAAVPLINDSVGGAIPTTGISVVGVFWVLWYLFNLA